MLACGLITPILTMFILQGAQNRNKKINFGEMENEIHNYAFK